MSIKAWLKRAVDLIVFGRSKGWWSKSWGQRIDDDYLNALKKDAQRATRHRPREDMPKENMPADVRAKLEARMADLERNADQQPYED